MKKDEFGKNISKIEKIIGYEFHDKSLLRQAFTRTSWCNEQGGRDKVSYQSNEVLEFFGDSVLSAVIISFLLEARTERYVHGIRTSLTEGDFSNIKSKLSDKTNLSLSTKRLGLEKFLLLGEGDVKLGIANEPSVMEDLFESIIGAVYIDSAKSMETVTRVVSGMLDMSVYTKEGATVGSAKGALQEWCADKSRRLPAPIYKTLGESGPDHKKVYERGVYVGDRLLGRAEGKNQKTADALAAKAALELLMAEEKPKSEAEAPTRVKKNAKEEPKASKRTVKNANNSLKSETKAKPVLKKPESKKKPTRAALSPESIKPEPKRVRISDGADLAFLKRHAKEKGLPSPTFHDLGIVRTHSGSIEYRIECELGKKRSVGVASTRTEAREAAIARLRGELEDGARQRSKAAKPKAKGKKSK